MIVDLEEASVAIASSLERAEQSAGREIHSVWVGITGHHIRAYPVEVSLQLLDGENITQEHLNALIEKAKKAKVIPEDHSVLHTLPRQFAINGVGGIKKPLGLSAREIKMQALVITSATSFMNNLAKCVRQAGVEIESMVLQPLAAGMS